PAALRILAPRGEVIAMVKPQFEVGPENVHKGVVRDPALRAAAIDEVARAAAELGLCERGRADSVLPGPEGNVEAFLRLARAEPSWPSLRRHSHGPEPPPLARGIAGGDRRAEPMRAPVVLEHRHSRENATPPPSGCA